jgi:hypothetical protein
VTGYLEAIHNVLVAYFLAQVHQRLGEVVCRHAVLASRSSQPYPAYFDDVRNRHFAVPHPVQPEAPVFRPQLQTFQPIHRPPITIRMTSKRNIEALQATLDDVKKILLLQQQRSMPPTVCPIPVLATATSSQVPPPRMYKPPSRLQQHFTSTQEPVAYRVPNPFCTECNTFHSPLNTNDFGHTDQESLDQARRRSTEELRVQADKFASDLLNSANVPPAHKRRATPATCCASPVFPAPTSSRPVSSPSLHRSLEPSPQPRLHPVKHETSGSSLTFQSPASPRPSFTDRMEHMSVTITGNRRQVGRTETQDQ